MKTFNSIGELWRHYVPTYKAGSYRPFHVGFPYDGLPGLAKRIREISNKRSSNRIANYVDEGEIQRVRRKLYGPTTGRDALLGDGASRRRKAKDVSIRFGVAKTGHGYSGERGDFCLVGGVYSGSTLTLFYRSIELIGGIAFDIVLIDYICKQLEITPKRIEIWSPKAFVFALKGNSNEKLYPKLKAILRVRDVRKAD